MRKLLVLVAGVVLLALASGAVLLAVVDPNDHKAMIEAWASEALGRPVRIEGPIAIERSLTPTLVANDVRIVGPQSTTLVSIKHAGLSIVLSSLLFGPVHLPHVGVDTATVDLPLELGDAAGSDGLPRIDQIVLSNISLRYRKDGDALNALLESATFEPAADRSTTTLQVRGDLDSMPFEVTGTTGSVEALFAGAPDWPLRIVATLGQGNLNLSGSLSLADGLAGSRLDVGVELPASARLAGDVELPALPIKASARLQAEKGILRVQALSASMGKSDLSGDLTWRSGTARAALAGKLIARRLDLGEILSATRIELPGNKVTDGGVVPNLPLLLPAQAFFDIDLDGTIGQLDLEGQPLTDLAAKLKVDETQLTLDVGQSRLGKGSVRGHYAVDSRGPANSVALKLDANALDLPALFDDPEGGSQLPKDVTVAVDLTGTGSDLRGFLGSAGGPIGITTGAAVIDDVFADLLGRSLFTALVPDWSSAPGAHIICSVLNLDAKSGKARSTALMIDAQRVVVGGGGAVELATGNIDFLLLPRAKRATLLPLVAPVHLVGTLTNPRVRSDASDILSSTGHLLLGIVNPLSLVTPILHPGLGGATPCATATLPAAQRENLFERAQGAAGGAVRDVEHGIGSVLEGIGGAAKKAFDGATGQ